MKINESPVNYIFGFINTDLDPLKQRGIFTGMVMIEDDNADSIIRNIDDPDIIPAQLLFASGSIAPLCPIGFKLPDYNNYSERFPQKYLFTNVLETYTSEEADMLLKKFVTTNLSQLETKLEDSSNQISKHVYIMPEIKPVRNRMAGIKDVVIRYRGDFIEQMIGFDEANE